MTNGNPMNGRRRLLGLMVLLATFLVGALAGAAGSRLLEAEDGATAERRRPARESSIIERLDLSADQQAVVDQILSRRRSQMKALWSDVGPQMEAIVDSTRQEIRNVLRPEQREAYERLIERKREHHRQKRDDR